VRRTHINTHTNTLPTRHQPHNNHIRTSTPTQHHQQQQLSFHELCALYAVTDVALINSLRDGMNLVSYEYVACQVRVLVVLRCVVFLFTTRMGGFDRI
jgi:hypothetical protein